MGLSRHIRLAIIGAVTLLFMIGHASSTSNFQFPDCVDKCIIKGDCAPTNSRCLCKAARGIFLKTVLKCMHASCKADLAAFEDSFLKPMTEGCDDIGQAIPKSSTKAAKALASSLLAKLSTATATLRTPMSSPVGSSPKITTATISTTSTSTSSSSDPIKDTSTVDRDVGVTKSSLPSPGNDSGLTQLTSLTSSGTETQATSSASPGSDFVDTSPFSNTNSAGLRNRLLTALLGLPLAVALMWR